MALDDHLSPGTGLPFSFNCHDGTEVPVDLRANGRKLLNALLTIEEYIKTSIRVNSVYRTPTHNAKVGGVKNSFHPKCMAADICTLNHSPRELAKVIAHLISTGAIPPGGVGVYASFVHYDVRGYNVTWASFSRSGAIKKKP